MTTAAAVGATVRAELARRGLPQRSLTTILEVSPTGVSKRLTGRTPLDVDELHKIAVFLEVPMATLVDGRP